MEQEPKPPSFKGIPVFGFGAVVSGTVRSVDLGFERNKVLYVGETVIELRELKRDYYFQKIVFPGLDGQEVEIMCGVVLDVVGSKIVFKGLTCVDFVPVGEVLAEPIKVETTNPLVKNSGR